MRLLSKTTLYYLFFTLGIFILGGFIFYMVLIQIIDSETDEILSYKEARIANRLKAGEFLAPDSIFTLEENLDIVATGLAPDRPASFQDTLLYDPIEQEYLLYRQITTTESINGEAYIIRFRQPLVESESLTEGILYSLATLFLILTAVLIVVNNRISNRLWLPFYTTLSQLKSYKITQPGRLKLDPANTREFDELNMILQQLTDQLQDDYRNLKEFTENVAHEIQTPLAIIQSKLELMLQSAHIDEVQMKLVESSYQAAGRLSKLNQALILLAKIENQEFHDITDVNLKVLLERHLDYFEELMDLRKLTLDFDLAASPTISMNPTLGDVLISNLLSNAIKHNVEHGRISIELTEHQIRISNTGAPTTRDPQLFFDRFAGDKRNHNSTGLGLAIVQKICELCSIRIEYSIHENRHILVLSF